MSVRILLGDCRQRLAELPDESVHCVVTSPPYWGLRDYGVAGQIGLEADYGQYVASMVEVFAEVRRVLRADGMLWLNLGDCYATGAGKVGGAPGGGDQGARWAGYRGAHSKVNSGKAAYRIPDAGMGPMTQPNRMPQAGLKAKDLVGIPWRVAFALQADGWWLRQDIIWSKPNPMPESVADRCTKAHEYLFLLTRSERYYFDQEAIAEDIATDPKENYPSRARVTGRGTQGAAGGRGNDRDKSGGFPPRRAKDTDGAARNPGSRPHRLSEFEAKSDRQYFTRNRRSVWTVTTQPFPEAHFATFPPALIEPCILAGCPVGGTVLDPFGGAGTTGLVADRLKRNAILIELNPAYAEMAERRIRGDAPMLANVSIEGAAA